MKQIEIFILKFLFIGHHSIVPKKTENFCYSYSWAIKISLQTSRASDPGKNKQSFDNLN